MPRPKLSGSLADAYHFEGRIGSFGRVLLDIPPDPLANGGVTQGTGGGTTPAAGQAGAPTITAQQLQSIAGPLLQEVRNQVTQQLAPITQAQTELRQRFEQMSQPQRNASQLFGGGAPGVRTGEDPLTSRGWSLQRVWGMRTGFYDRSQCKVEYEIHQKLWDFYVEKGGMGFESRQSLLIPLGTSMLAGLDTPDLQHIEQAMGAGIEGMDRDALKYRLQRAMPGNWQQALSQFDDSGLGVFLGPTQRSGELIELIRKKEVFSRVGATQLTLPPNGRLQFDRQTGAVTAYWVGEVPSDKSSPTITASSPTTGALTMLAKKLAVLVKLPNELLRFATAEIEAFIRNDMARVAALEADISMLEAVGSTNRIKGLITYAGLTPFTATTVATDGNTFEPEDIALMKAALEEANHDPESGSPAWVMRPKMFANLRNRRAAAHTAATYDGGWLFPVNRDDIGRGMDSRIDGDLVVKSTQVSNTRAKGSATDLSYILYGLWNHWIIGRVGVAEIAMTDKGDTAFQTDQTWMRFIQHMDAGARYEDAFVMCDTIDMDAP